MPGTIGFFHDWPFGPFPEMTDSYANSGLYIWDTQNGILNYPSDWIFKLFLIPIAEFGLGGETLTKGLLMFSLTLSGYGAFFLARRMGLGYISSFITGLVYLFSPIVFTRIISGYVYYLIAYFITPFVVGFFLYGSKITNDSLNAKNIFIKYKYFIIAGILFSFSIQLQFFILIPLILLLFLVFVFRTRHSLIGFVFVITIAFLVTIFPFFLTNILIEKNFDRQLLNPIYLLNSYHEIETSPSLYDGFRLLGYSSHPYSYTNLGTLNDPLYFESLYDRIISDDFPNLLTNPEFKFFSGSNLSKPNSSILPKNWTDMSENCSNEIFLCNIVNVNDTGVIDNTDNLTDNKVIDQLPDNILKVNTTNNNENQSNIVSDEIPIKIDQNFVTTINIKTNNYTVNSNVVLEGFNNIDKAWIPISPCPASIDGHVSWTSYLCYSSIDPAISKIRLVLHAGWSSEQGKEAITYFGNMYVTPVQDNSLIVPDWIFDLNIVIPVIGFSSLILYKKNKFVIALAFISLIGLFLLKGTNPPFSNVFEFLFINGLYIFREIWHFAFLYSFGISFLIGFFMNWIIRIKISHFTKNRTNNNTKNKFYIMITRILISSVNSRKIRISLSLFLTAIIIMSNGYPLLIGSFGGYLQTYSFPEEYYSLFNRYTQTPNYNILILPLFAPIQYGDLKISGIDPFLTYAKNNIFHSLPFSGSNEVTSWTSLWLHTVILENNTETFGKILSGFGIKYVILRDDFTSHFVDFISLESYKPFRDKWYSSLEPFLDSQKDLDIVENTSNFKVYENANYANKFFVPRIDLPQFSSYDGLLKLSDVYPLSNFSTYPINSKNYDNKSANIDKTNYIDFIDMGKYTVSNNPLEWTTNKFWFGYDYLLGSRYHTGAFIIGNTVNGTIILNDAKTLPTIDFDLPLENYKNKHIQIWLKALEWPEGGNVEVDIYDKNNNNNSNSFSSSQNLYSDVPNFSLVKVFDGFIGENKTNDYGFKVSNLHGNNYLEGLYILDIDSFIGDKIPNDTSINQHVLDLAINKHAEYISSLDFLINNVSSTSNKTFFNNQIDQNSNQGLNLILNPHFKKLISDTDAKNFVNININSYNTNLNEDVFLAPTFNTSINSNSDHNVQSFLLGWTDYSNNCNSESGSFICKVIKQPTNTSDLSNRNTNQGYENNSESVFQVSTNTTVANTWSHIGSNEISVSEGQSYSIHGSLRLNDFVKQSHIVVEGFNDELYGWFTLTQCPPGVDGPSDWTTFICTVDIPESVSKIRLVLNAGWTSQPGKQATTNFADIGLFKIDKTNVHEADFNNIIPYNYLNNISSIITDTDMPNKRSENSSIVPMEMRLSATATNAFNFTKVDPTLWKVTVNESFAKQDDSWTLAFAEAFDPLWQAHVYDNGSLLQISKSKPLYGAINGFEINIDSKSDTDAGDIDIIIRYLPQELFEIGTKISLVTLFLLLGLLLIISILFRKKEN